MTTLNRIAPSDLGLSAALMLIGQIGYIAVTQVHTGGEANDHHHIFADYAESALWTAVHLAQFVSMALLLLGLFALAKVIEAQVGAAKWLARFGAGTALVSLALYGVLQAVDGVALKHAVTAWASAPEAEQAARFATAESIRWLEWGMRSYHDFALGFTLLLFAGALAGVRHVARPVAWLVGFSGLAYLAQGWVAGTDGFTSAQSVAIIAAWALTLVWMIWLAVAAARTQKSELAFV